MHTPIDKLLSLRDGEPVDADLLRHIGGCTACSAELNRLRGVQQRMQALALIEPPALAWNQIQARVQSPPPRTRFALAAVAAVAIAVVSGLLVRNFDQVPQKPAVVAQSEPAASAGAVPLEHLVAQSRELDDMLQGLPVRPAVERVTMAATIDSIEQRVQWLDQQLSYAPEGGLNEAQTYQLWRERVDLMNSLVKVRYVEGGPMSF